MSGVVSWLLIFLAGGVAAYAVLVGVLLISGRRADARALAGFVPDCAVLVRRMLADPRVPRRSKLMLVGLAGYLASPFDLVPELIPVVGQIDDALIAGLVMRRVLRGCGPEVLREHWPGPERSLRVLLRLSA
jgi:uncharacterized membrane protein YkvA (DUF1232 family)